MKKTVKALSCLSLLAGAVACTNPNWDDHYASNADNILSVNLMEAIQARSSDLGIFIDMLHRTGYDTLLATSQSYTVWAPSDAWLQGIDMNDEVEVRQVVMNHISRFPYPTSHVAYGNKSVKMIDSKRVLFSRQPAGFYFGEQPLKEQDVAVNNGILHVLDGYEPYVRSILEYIKYDASFKNVYDFIMSYDENEFLPDESAIIGVVDGQTIYDSVFYHRNPLLTTIGDIGSEDEQFTMVVPDNEAWASMYDSISRYFVVSPHNHGVTQEMCDSMQNQYTNIYLMYDLVYKGQVTPDSILGADRLMTTTRTIIDDPKAFFAEEGSLTGLMSDTVLSNGIAYRAHSLNLKREEWCPSMLIEAEATRNISSDVAENNTRNVFSRDARGTLYADSISRMRYVEVNPRSLSVLPYVTYNLDGLNSATYNIYVVFVPQLVNYSPYDTIPELLPSKVWFELSYVDESGTISSEYFYSLDPIEVDPYRMDTVKVTYDDWMMEDAPVTFPYYDAFTDEHVGTRLRIYSGVGSTEMDRYSRDMLIDCILVEPVD